MVFNIIRRHRKYEVAAYMYFATIIVYMVVFLFNSVVYVFLLLCLLLYVCLIVYLSYCMFMYLHRPSWHSSATLNEVFPCFFSVIRQMPG